MSSLGRLQTREDGRFALRFERRFAHPVEKVWRAITEPDHLRAWFPALVEIEPTPGAKLRFDLMPEALDRYDIPEEDVTLYGEVTAADPPRLLEYTWAAEVLRWELESVEGGCRMTFTHVIDDRRMAAPAGAGWHATFEALEAVLDGRPMERSAIYDRSDQLGDEYDRSLG